MIHEPSTTVQVFWKASFYPKKNPINGPCPFPFRVGVGDPGVQPGSVQWRGVGWIHNDICMYHWPSYMFDILFQIVLTGSSAVRNHGPRNPNMSHLPSATGKPSKSCVRRPRRTTILLVIWCSPAWYIFRCLPSRVISMPCAHCCSGTNSDWSPFIHKEARKWDVKDGAFPVYPNDSIVCSGVKYD